MNNLTNISPQDIEERSLQDHEPHWLRRERMLAWENFKMLDYPDWRRAKMSKVDLLASTTIDVQGKISTPLKKDLAYKGVIFCDMRTAVLERADLLEKYWEPSSTKDKFSAFRDALWQNGFFLYIPAGLVIDQPFQVELLQKDRTSALLQNVVIMDEGSEAVLEVSYRSENNGSEALVCSTATKVVLEAGARMKLISTQNWGKNIVDLAQNNLHAGKDAHLRALFVLLGGQSGRTIIRGDVSEPGANIEHDGIVIGDGEQRFKIISEMKHSANHTEGMMKYKGILKDKSYSSLDGLVTMLPNAQKSISRLEEHTLLLSDKARCDALPALDIRASDVKVSHSASVSQADQEKIFYLMSRGLSQEEAKSLIIQGFFENLLEMIPDPRAYDRTKELIEGKLMSQKYD